MKAINELLNIMKTLRDPELGCPWDRTQTIQSISSFTLEEVYELIESIETEDMPGLCDELGDLLFHIVFYAEMASEAGHFDFETLSRQVVEKLQRRHPHVFSDSRFNDDTALSASWEKIKEQEREEKSALSGQKNGLLDDIGLALPAMIRAEKLQKRAATVGFDWPSLKPVVAKIEEELEELKREIDSGADASKLEDELGDVLFSCVNLGRHLGISTESALRRSNRKFETRFACIEEGLQIQGMRMQDATLEQMDELWHRAKIDSGQ